MHDGCHRVGYSRLQAPPIARAMLLVGFLLKFVPENQFSAALATTAPARQPANRIASQIAGAKLAIHKLKGIELMLFTPDV